MAKPTKSKEELESLIMDEIRQHPVCPPDMGVSVRGTGDGSWRADAVPPPGSHVGYPDCANYISEVVGRLRSQYDLGEVPPPGTYGGDDAANYAAIRAHAERQLRNIAARSSGTTEPVNLATHLVAAADLTTGPPEIGRPELFENPDPRALFQEILWRLDAIEQTLANLPAGIGHNRPPETIEPVPFTDEDRKVVEQAIVVLREQPPHPASPPAEAIQAAVVVRTLGERIGHYITKQADAFVSETVKGAGKEFGKRIVQMPFWIILSGQLVAIGTAVSRWIVSLGGSPF
jgi:hypothetical protein